MNFLAKKPKRFPRAAVVATLSVFMLALVATAGSLTPNASPASTFKTLEEIYDAIASDSFDSSSFAATNSGSLINHLLYIEQNLGWASTSPDIYTLNSGNVGIGDSTPEVKFEVVGGASFSDTLYANGGCVGCGGGVSSNSLDFDEFVDAMTLDANLSIASNGFTWNFSDINIEGAGTASLSNVFIASASESRVYIGELNDGQGSAATAAQRNSVLDIGHTQTGTAGGTALNIQALWDFSSDGSGIAGIEVNTQTKESNANNMTGTMTGLIARSEHGGSGTATTLTGITATSNNRSGGDVTTATGLFGSTTANGGTIYDARAIVGENLLLTSGVVSRSYSVLANSPNIFSGTVINAAGLISEEISGATNNTNLLLGTTTIPSGSYSIYNASTRANFFGGGASWSGNLDPTTDDTYDLGQSDLRWRDLYLGPGSLHIGTSGNQASISYSTSINTLLFGVNGAEFVSINSSGNVGIASSSPTSLFVIANDLGGPMIKVGSTAAEVPTSSGGDSGSTRFSVNGNGGHPITILNDAGVTDGYGIHINAALALGAEELNLFRGGLDRNSAATAIGFYSGANQDIVFQPGRGLSASNVYAGIIDETTGYWGIGSSVSPNTILDIQGTASASAGVFTNAVNVALGNTSTVSYSRFGTGTTNHALTASDDLLITGLLELNNQLFADSNASISGTLEITLDGTVSGASQIKLTDSFSSTEFGLVNNNGTLNLVASPSSQGYIALSIASQSGGVDIGKPARPKFKGKISGTGAPNFLGFVNDVFVSGKYAYGVGGTDNSLTIVDISNPSSPSFVGNVAGAANFLLGANHVFVSGNYAYVTTTTDDGLTIFDVSDPTNPTFVAESVDLADPNWVYVSGKYAYVTATTGADMTVLDISNPHNPQIVGDVTISGGPRAVYVAGRYAYVVTGGTPSGLSIIDIIDPTNPSEVGRITGSGAPNFLALASDVYVSGRYAYVAAYTDDSLTVIDVSDPTSPTFVGNISGASNFLDGINTLSVSGRYAYVSAQVSDAITIIDVSNPTTPTFVGHIAGAGAPNFLNLPQSVQVVGKYAYVAAFLDNSLTIIDLGGLETPTLYAGDIVTSAVEVHDNLTIGNDLYVSNGALIGGGLMVNGRFGITVASLSTNIASISSAELFSIRHGKGRLSGDGLVISLAESGSQEDYSGNFARFSLAGSDLVIFESSGAILASGAAQFGSAGAPSSVSYSRFGTGTTGHSLTAADDLLISGLVEFDDRAFFDANVSVSADFEVTGYASASQYFGAGLVDCDTGATDKLLWDVTTGAFSCGTDQTAAGSGVTSDSLDFDEFVDGTMTLDGSLIIASAGGTITWEPHFANNLIPATTATYGLGSDSLRWSSLFLASGSLHIGSAGNDSIIDFNTTSYASDALAFYPDSTTDPTFLLFDDGFIGVNTTAPAVVSSISDAEQAFELYHTELVLTGENANESDERFGLSTDGGTLYISASDIGNHTIAQLTSDGAFAIRDALQVGHYEAAGTAYSRFGTDTALSNDLTSSEDLLVSGDLEVHGTISFGGSGGGSGGNLYIDTNVQRVIHIKSSDGDGTQMMWENTSLAEDQAWSIYTVGAVGDTSLGTEEGAFAFVDSTDDTTRMVLTRENRLGIASGSPIEILSVVGNARFDGQLGVGNFGGVDQADWYGNTSSSSLTIYQYHDSNPTPAVDFITGINSIIELSGATNELYGISSQVIADSSGTPPVLNALYANPVINDSATETSGLWVYTSMDGREVSSSYGVFVTLPEFNYGTIDEVYGVYIDDYGDGTDPVSMGSVSATFNLYMAGEYPSYSAGRLGIGTDDPIHELHVSSGSEGFIMRLEDSDGTCDLDPDSGGLTTSCSSDIRLKSDVGDAPSIMAELMQLKIREYTVKASGNRTIGVIAQEVQETHPELVSANDKGILMVRQPGVWELVKGIQELQDQLDVLALPMPSSGLQDGDIDALIAQLGGQRGLIERLITALESAVLRVGTLFAGLIKADEVQTERLCVGDTCVTEREFYELLEKNDIDPAQPVVETEPKEVPASSSDDAGQEAGDTDSSEDIEAAGGGSESTEPDDSEIEESGIVSDDESIQEEEAGNSDDATNEDFSEQGEDELDEGSTESSDDGETDTEGEI